MMPPEKLPPPALSGIGRMRRRFEQFLSGRAPDDPLYLTNRTSAQKLKVGAMIAVPALVLGVLVMGGATGMFHFNKADQYEHPLAEAQPPHVSPAPAAAPAPDSKPSPKDLEVVNLQITKGETPPVVTGEVRNNTNRNFVSAEVSFYLSDGRGSLLGTESTHVPEVTAHNAVTFRAPLKTLNAEYVMLREVRLN
jgi:hypothetical protein